MSTLIIAFLQGLVREWPEIIQLFKGTEPTEADWAAFKAKVSAKTYKDYVPDTKLPPEET